MSDGGVNALSDLQDSHKLQTKKKTLQSVFFLEFGTEDGTRTHKPVRALPPQGSVSTNSTTSVQNT